MARGGIGFHPWRDEMGHNGCDPPPTRVQNCTRLPALTFKPGNPSRIFGAATTYIFRALPGWIFRALTGSVLSRQHSLLPGLLGGIFFLITTEPQLA